MKYEQPENDKENTNENLLQLLSLLASLQDDENDIPTLSPPIQQNQPGFLSSARPGFQQTNFQETKLPTFQQTRPGFQTTRFPNFQETKIPTFQQTRPGLQTTRFPNTLPQSSPDDNLPSVPGPPYLDPTPFSLPTNRPGRPPKFQRPLQRPVRRPAASQTSSRPYLPNGVDVSSSSLLDQMLSDLLGTTVADTPTFPTTPQRLPQPPSPSRFSTVDLVVGGVPRPGLTRPSLASPGRYPIRLPPPLKDPGFSLPSDTIRPQRQFDVSTIRGAYGESTIGESRASSDGTVQSAEPASFYPQSISWDQNSAVAEDEANYGPTREVNELPRASLVPSTNVKALPEATTPSRVKDIHEEVTSLKTGSFKDNQEFQSLVAQLNSTLERLREQEEERRRRQQEVGRPPVVQQEADDEGPELIYVNIWNNVGGKLQLTGQKPMLRESFEEMQSRKDFSSLLDTDLTSQYQSSPWQPAHQSPQGNTKHPGWPKPNQPIQGIQNVELEEYIRRQRNPEAQLPMPAYLQSLFPSTPAPNPHHQVYPPHQSPWKLADIGPQGVGADSALPSYADTQGLQQDEQNPRRFLENPLLIQRPFSQRYQTTRPPNFTPIPIPQVLQTNYRFFHNHRR